MATNLVTAAVNAHRTTDGSSGDITIDRTTHGEERRAQPAATTTNHNSQEQQRRNQQKWLDVGASHVDEVVERGVKLAMQNINNSSITNNIELVEPVLTSHATKRPLYSYIRG